MACSQLSLQNGGLWYPARGCEDRRSSSKAELQLACLILSNNSVWLGLAFSYSFIIFCSQLLTVEWVGCSCHSAPGSLCCVFIVWKLRLRSIKVGEKPPSSLNRGAPFMSSKSSYCHFQSSIRAHAFLHIVWVSHFLLCLEVVVMAIFANSTDKSAPRGFPWMWYIRFVQVLLTLIVIAVAARVAATISNGDGDDCHAPHKVVWNIVCVGTSVIYRVFGFWPRL